MKAKRIVFPFAWLLLAATWLPGQTEGPTPLQLGFAGGQPGTLPQPWFAPPALKGWRAELVDDDGVDDGRCVRLGPEGDDAGALGNVMRLVPAEGLAGRRVRLQARLRVDGPGRAQMWLRVDRPRDLRGAFDNMHDRPVTSRSWTEATIELDVAEDAAQLALGVLAFDGATVSIDDVTLTAVGAAAPTQPATPPMPLTDRELANATAASRLLGYLWFFHPSEALVDMASWHHLAVDLLDAALPARDDADLCARLAAVTGPIAPRVQLWAGGPEAAPPALPAPDDATHLRWWKHAGAGRVAASGNVYESHVVERRRAQGDDAPPAEVVALAGSAWARVPVAVWSDGSHSVPAAAVPAAWRERWRVELGLQHRTTRLAAVAEAWNVFQHFYPYFDVVDADWAAELPRALSLAAVSDGPAATEAVLQQLVAALHDGHGQVMGAPPLARGNLPVAVRWLGDGLVVTGVADGVEGVAVGDVLQAIDGRAVADIDRDLSTRISAATEGWRRTRSQWEFARLPTNDPVTLSLRRVDGTRAEVTAPRAERPVPAATDRRPANGAALADGIVYFDLCGATADELARHLDALRGARAIVFDLRGYPDAAAVQVLEMLLTAPGQSARWGIPVAIRPDRQDWQWNENGRWNMRPKNRLDAEVAFVTDGRAISYAESVMGIVEAYGLGAIVGATTAGTNGNVNPFDVVGGLRISWTGMRVRKHDGSRHHGVGIAPTVPVEPTAAGIAAGRDEVLERAIEVLQAELGR